MSLSPIEKTFNTLMNSKSSHVVELLAESMQADIVEIRRRACRQLFQRPSTRGRFELVRFFHRIPKDEIDSFQGRVADFSIPLGQAFAHGLEQVKFNALEVVRLVDDYEQIPVMLPLLESNNPVLAENTIMILRDMVHALFEHANFSRQEKASQTYLRNAPQLVHKVLIAMDHALEKFDELHRPELLIESIFILGGINHFSINKVLHHSSTRLKEMAYKILFESTHEGIMSLLISHLNLKLPSPRVMSIIRERSDAIFVMELMRSLPRNLTANQHKNLQSLGVFSWLSSDSPLVQSMPVSMQLQLLSIITHMTIDPIEDKRIKQWLLRNGCAEVRNAITDMLSHSNPDDVKEVVIEGLNSKDENVQAWAVSQLRTSHVPDAMKLLVDKLDSNEQIVREASQLELKAFDVDRVVELCDQLSPDMCEKLGHLMQKIDPEAIDKLAREMAHPARKRRMKAAIAATRMNISHELVPAILSMLTDHDALVRRISIESLIKVKTPEVMFEIQNMLADPSPRVREAATEYVNQYQNAEIS
jgi:hypothetical protein